MRRLGWLVLAGTLGAPALAERPDVDQLWVPQSYIRHLPQMYDGAALVADSQRCVEFISGEIHLDRSTLEHPVFRYLCRDERGHTLAKLVDGPTLELIDETRPGGQISFAELAAERERKRAERERVERERAEREATLREDIEREREQQSREREEEQALVREKEQRQRARERRERLWPECQSAIRDRLGRMAGLEWLTDGQPEPVTEEEDLLVFEVDFDAEDLHGQALSYRAYCEVDAEDELSVSIRPRRLVDEGD